jgi:hypothetical protein
MGIDSLIVLPLYVPSLFGLFTVAPHPADGAIQSAGSDQTRLPGT